MSPLVIYRCTVGRSGGSADQIACTKWARWLVLVAGAMSFSGCHGVAGGLLRAPGPVAPVVLKEGATAEEILAAVNRNTARVRSYTTYQAKFSIPGMASLPLMQGNIALERPMKFRLQAGTSVLGPEIDFGSNHERLWFWVKRNQPPALYYCRHDEFATSGARQLLPVDPNWIGDALGLVELNPLVPHEGPFRRTDGTLELRAPISSPAGPMTRVVVVDPTRAWVREQHLYDQENRLAASAIAEDFRYDPVALVSLPRKITVRVPPAGLALSIDVGQVQLNTSLGESTQLWTMPMLDGYPLVDLGSSPSLPQSLPLSDNSSPASSSPPWARSTRDVPPTVTAVTPATALRPRASSYTPVLQRALEGNPADRTSSGTLLQPTSFSSPRSTSTATLNRLPPGGIALRP